MATILLTGATGTVGSCLAPLLKSQGHQLVYLIRSKNGQSAEQRLVGKTENDVIWDGDIVLAHLGITDAERRSWRGRIDKIVNCAASIKLTVGFFEETTRINVDGVRNLLELAEELKIPEFHQVSTAYVAGTANYLSEEDFDVGQPRNVYEKTKREAERLIRKWRYGRFSIYRLGIVVGNYDDGYISTFNGYYVFASSLWHLRKSLLEKSKAELKEYGKEGIGFDLDGMLTLPVYFNFSPSSTLNIVPIDWAAETLAKLAEIPAGNKVFHVVHPKPQKARWVNNVSLKHLGIQGFYYGDFCDTGSKSLLGRLQRAFDKNTKQYLPYITHECRFGVANAPYILGDKYRLPPEIDEMFVVTLLDYAKSVDFGRKRAQSVAVVPIDGLPEQSQAVAR